MARDVHVLHVVRTLGAGGGMERNLHRLVIALSGRGIRHSIALLSDWPDIIDFSPYAETTRLVTPPNDPRLVWMLKRHIDRCRPTVIHARNWGAWPDVAAARWLTWPRPPLIFSYHGMESADAVPWRHKLAFVALAGITDRMFAVSGPARDLLKQTFGVRFRKIDVISNGVNTDRFHPRPDREDGPMIIGTSGRLHPIKNIPLLLSAVAALAPAHRDVRVHIAGDGPDRPELEHLAQTLGIFDRVTFLGHVTDMPAFLRTLDLFVLASDNEANPNALLEAMATGLPSVATAVGGTVEVTDHGRAARLVPARNVTAMAEALTALLQKEDDRRQLGQTARAWILDRYGQSAMMDAYERLYRNPRGES